MGVTIFISVMVLCGFGMMAGAILTKKKDIENLSTYGATDLFEIIFNLIFSFSTVTIKRILIFTFGLLWSGLFMWILITGNYWPYLV